MKPIKKQIIFKPFASPETVSGLFVPESARRPNNKGEVIDIGSEVTRVKVGDVGFRVKEFGTEVLIEGEKMILMEETAILCKI
jgi:co-chaperonin GroES (HSP10)